MDAPKPICFMVTPFGVKETQVAAGRGPPKVDFDVLWQKVFEPLLTDLGYDAVRADVDLGASIIRDMIERLALSDLVVADVSLPNANVFYEVGVRHAACEKGCVLVAARWAKQPFDTQSMRHEPYDLVGEKVTDEEARENRTRLAPRVRDLAEAKTPCYEMDGFPKLSLARAQSFRESLKKMSAVNGRISAVRLEPDREQRRTKARALVDEVSTPVTQLPFVIAYELVKLLRDAVGWEETVAFIDRLPESLRSRSSFAEQRALALSKHGQHFEAIGALEQLIQISGESPERRGLLGGRYKKLWREKRDSDPGTAAGYLDNAIEQYELGRKLDLNEYYAASNLPLLLRTRATSGDAERAARIAVSVVAACERAIDLKTADEWVYPTLLVAAFHSGDVEKARELLGRVRKQPKDWKFETTLSDLRDAVRLQAAGPVRDQLETMLAALGP